MNPLRKDHRFTLTFRVRRAKDQALASLQTASASAGLGRYNADRVRNAELFAEDGRPWREVRYARMPRIHQCERRVRRIGTISLHAPVMM